MIQDLTSDLAEALVLASNGGAIVASVEPATPAKDADLRPGDVITEGNRQAVTSLCGIDRTLENAPSAIALSVWRNGRRLFLVPRS